MRRACGSQQIRAVTRSVWFVLPRPECSLQMSCGKIVFCHEFLSLFLVCCPSNHHISLIYTYSCTLMLLQPLVNFWLMVKATLAPTFVDAEVIPLSTSVCKDTTELFVKTGL